MTVIVGITSLAVDLLNLYISFSDNTSHFQTGSFWFHWEKQSGIVEKNTQKSILDVYKASSKIPSPTLIVSIKCPKFDGWVLLMCI